MKYLGSEIIKEKETVKIPMNLELTCRVIAEKERYKNDSEEMIRHSLEIRILRADLEKQIKEKMFEEINKLDLPEEIKEAFKEKIYVGSSALIAFPESFNNR